LIQKDINTLRSADLNQLRAL